MGRARGRKDNVAVSGANPRAAIANEDPVVVLTGYADVDALIENYRSRAVELGVDQLLEADVYALIESYRSLSIHDATHAKGPRDVPVEALRDPEIADGLCSLVADDFARYLCERLQGEDINVHPEVQDDEEPPYGKAWGYDDRTREPGWGSHTLVVIERGLEMMTVDWTASQFGYADFPLVQRLVVGEDENWQRLSAS